MLKSVVTALVITVTLLLSALGMSGCGLLRDAGYPQGICHNGTINGNPANCHVG
jgi:hypothetical protein